jgi:hypothetical protein
VARRLRFLQKIDFSDTRGHVRGPLCWCRPEYSEKDHAYYHNLRFDEGANMKHDREFKA